MKNKKKFDFKQAITVFLANISGRFVSRLLPDSILFPALATAITTVIINLLFNLSIFQDLKTFCKCLFLLVGTGLPIWVGLQNGVQEASMINLISTTIIYGCFGFLYFVFLEERAKRWQNLNILLIDISLLFLSIGFSVFLSARGFMNGQFIGMDMTIANAVFTAFHAFGIIGLLLITTVSPLLADYEK